MKNSSKPSASKLVTKFDSHLKNILMDDLKAFKLKRHFFNHNHQASAASNLSAA